MQLFEPIFAALEAGQVRYVAVGGIATILHGVIRLTRDVDLVVDLDPEQARRAINVLTELGFVAVAPVREKPHGRLSPPGSARLCERGPFH